MLLSATSSPQHRLQSDVAFSSLTAVSPGAQTSGGMQRAMRLKKELAMLAVSPPAGVSCASDGDDMTRLKATITGPEGSPFEKGTFQLDVVVPER